MLPLIGNFILTVTRVSPEKETNKTLPKKINIKRKSIKPSKTLSIYRFHTFDEFCEFCTYLNTSHLSNFIKKLKHSMLYLYKDKYYLSLYNLNFSIKDLKSLHCIITEFGAYTNHPEIFERKLVEYGKIIIKTNAINTCIKHFG